MQEIYKRKMGEMRERLKTESKKLTVVESRRKMDLQGFESDLKSMEKKVKFYLRYVGKLRKLVEDENMASLRHVDVGFVGGADVGEGTGLMGDIEEEEKEDEGN